MKSSDPAQPPLEKKRLSPGGCLFFCGCIGLIALLGLVLSFVAWNRAAAQRLNKQLAAIRAAGDPVSAKDLDKFYAKPEESLDTTRLWIEATTKLSGPAFNGSFPQHLPIIGSGQAEIPPPGEPWPDLEEVEAVLEQSEAAMQMLHQAADAGGLARYPAQFQDGFNMRLEFAQNLRSGARMLALQAHARAHRGDSQGTARSIRTCLVLARSVKQEPVLVSQLVNIAVQKMSHGLIQDLLPYVNFSDEDLAMLQQTLRSADNRYAIRRAMKGERALGIHSFREGAAAGIHSLPIVLNEDLSQYVTILTEVVDATEKPWHEAIAITNKIDDQMRRNFSSHLNRVKYMVTLQVVPATGQALMAGAAADASGIVSDTALAIERHRLKQGRVPETLGELVPDYLPRPAIDPFDGKPLRYKVEKDQVVIYSIGRDLVDDDGRSEENGTGDVDLILPRQR